MTYSDCRDAKYCGYRKQNVAAVAATLFIKRLKRKVLCVSKKSSFQGDVHAFVGMLSLEEGLNPGITEESFLDFVHCLPWKEERRRLQEISSSSHRPTQSNKPR